MITENQSNIKNSMHQYIFNMMEILYILTTNYHYTIITYNKVIASMPGVKCQGNNIFQVINQLLLILFI